MSTSTPPRRFAPEPVETSVKSSRRFAPEPVETSSRSSRRFVPEPMETTTKTVRRFAPQPVETVSRSNRPEPASNLGPEKRLKFSPILVETTSKTNRKELEESSNLSRSTAQPAPSSHAPPQRQPRKFAPQLIETAKRSRKAGDTRPALLPSDKTEAILANASSKMRGSRPHHLPMPPDNTPVVSSENIQEILQARRLGLPIAPRRGSISSTRSHSFRVPDLDPIDSSQSEESNPPSLSSSPSGSDQSYMYKHATRLRESVDDRYSGYFLQVAARAAEKQLREQALAAFPNDDQHEPVDHFIDRDVDESHPGSLIHKGSSFVEIDWELREMQAHQERLSQDREREKRRTQPANAKAEEANAGPWRNPAAGLYGVARDAELERMRNDARPPMLGGDIKFPRCSSPEPARFDVTQGSQALRESMCYLTQQSQTQEDHEGLWAQKKNSSQKPSLWSTPASRTPSHGGLWGGCCVGTGATPPRGPSGLMTPYIEIENPLDTPDPSPYVGLAPTLVVPSTDDITGIDQKLEKELTIEDEFNDAFITQVYNYLSMGYPSIARDYDAELSKISRVSIAELRQDDHLTQSRGYIRLGEDEKFGVAEESCMRWRALRLYVHEWARQQPGMVSAGHTLGGFGVGAAVRKGSWAI